MNKDQLKGRIEQAKGSIKQTTGALVGDDTLEAEGIVQRNLGKLQEKVGDLEQDVKDSLK